MAENTQAFPRTLERWNGSYDHEKGMTLRDYFAGQALAGMSDGNDPLEVSADASAEDILAAQCKYWSSVARTAYLVADAMLIEREKANG